MKRMVCYNFKNYGRISSEGGSDVMGRSDHNMNGEENRRNNGGAVLKKRLA